MSVEEEYPLLLEDFQFLIAHMDDRQLSALCRLLKGAWYEVQRLRHLRS